MKKDQKTNSKLNKNNQNNNEIEKDRKEWSKEWGLEKQTEGLNTKDVKKQADIVEELNKTAKK